MIHRKLEQVIKNDFNKSKAIVVMGARQVGKTTALGTKALCVVWNYKALFECLVPLHNALPRAHSYDGVGYATVYTDRTPAHAH